MQTRFLIIAFVCIALEGAADAHDCSSPEDCEDVVKTSGWLEAALALAAAIAAAKVKPYKRKSISEKWKDCATAKADMQSRTDAGRTDWQATPEVNGKATPKADGTWEFKGKGSYQLDITVEIPDWTDMPKDAAHAHAWKSFINSLQAHEEGHVAIVKKELSSQQNVNVTGKGATAKEAMQDALENYRRDSFDPAVTRTKDRQADYDTVTDHGRQQSKVGGKNIELVCP